MVHRVAVPTLARAVLAAARGLVLAKTPGGVGPRPGCCAAREASVFAGLFANPLMRDRCIPAHLSAKPLLRLCEFKLAILASCCSVSRGIKAELPHSNSACSPEADGG